jgi:hypothetical protein
MKARDAFLLALLFLVTYTALTGQIFGRPDLTDKYYHINKAMNPLAGEYYSPLFHIIVYIISLFLGTFTALNLFVALLLFLLTPKMFNLAYNSFWGEHKNTDLYYFFVLWFTIMTFITNTWPQVLSLFFMFIVLTLIFKRANPLLIFLVAFIGFFSHTAGGFWIITTAVFYMLLEHRKWGIALIAVIIVLMVVYPAVYIRPLGIFNNFLNVLDLNPRRILEVLLLWLNPLNIYLIYCGLKDRKYFTIDDIILWFAVLVSFALAILDVELRPIVNGMLLLGLYGFKGFEKHNGIASFMVGMGVYYWITLVIMVLRM